MYIYPFKSFQLETNSLQTTLKEYYISLYLTAFSNEEYTDTLSFSILSSSQEYIEPGKKKRYPEARLPV